MNTKSLSTLLTTMLASASMANAQDFQLSSSGYFSHEGVNAMAFEGYSPIVADDIIGAPYEQGRCFTWVEPHRTTCS